MIPEPSPVPPGLAEALEAAGLLREISPDGWGVTDDAAALAFIAAYDPKPAETAWRQAQATASKWTAIEAGIDFEGIPVRTDEASRARLLELRSAARDSSGPFAFKDANGVFHSLTADQALALTAAVSAHVQACFAREAEMFALDVHN